MDMYPMLMLETLIFLRMSVLPKLFYRLETSIKIYKIFHETWQADAKVYMKVQWS